MGATGTGIAHLTVWESNPNNGKRKQDDISDAKHMLANPQILILDDNQTLTKVLQFYLSNVGFDTFTASTGAAARLVLQDTHVDLVLLDIGLPDCNGLEWLKEMREHGMSLPVVMLTAQADPASITEATRLNVTAYIRKPFSLRCLRRTVDSALRDNRLMETRDDQLLLMSNEGR